MDAVVVEDLSKRYRIYAKRWHRLCDWLGLGGSRTWSEERWALRGIGFKVSSGESVGIVGQNGAGKSTLLKILTGTTQASEGRFAIGGSVAALLELGMGFHPEFSGRQNAIMGLQLLGRVGSEIPERLEEIERFSELGSYLDQPIRTFSSGMYVRLAFSVATSIRPDVLIVDEALAVGDAYFQHKSMRRIRDFREQGTTLLFVSHDPFAVKTLCDRALLLDRGLLIRDGPSDAVLDYYNAMIAKKERDAEIRQIEAEGGRTITRSGDGRARILFVDMLDGTGAPSRAFRIGERIRVVCRIEFRETIPDPTVGFLIRDRLGNDVFGTNTYHLGSSPGRVSDGEILEIVFETVLNLGCGNYSLTGAVHAGDSHLDSNFDWWDRALVFQIIPGDSFRFVGTASLPVRANVSRLKGSEGTTTAH
jgi:lipopolysaccharide transport system ATP-binding protein